jgi:NAD-dependent deacetylase
MISSAALGGIQKAANIIKNARCVVAFTGAGISTPSGIPDFRSSRTGLWQKDDPMHVASLTAFRFHPERFFAWFKPLLQQISSAQPNPAHTSLAQLETAGKIQAVITQNIDMLHQKAGSKHVFPLHGSVDRLICPNCKTVYLTTSFLERFLQQDIMPRCLTCDRYLKPDIVLYEEYLPQDIWNGAEELIKDADGMIVVGSSLEVFPACTIPQMAVENHASLIINNISSTPLDEYADVLLPFNAVEILPAIAELVLKS